MTVNILGAGMAGLSAALTLSENKIHSRLISVQPSERAQSVLAEGGMNGALNTMGEDDHTYEHCADTLNGGVYLADPNAVAGLTEAAPVIIRRLHSIGVPFNMDKNDLVLRNFGGQKKKRTAYAKSSTGKVVMTALIDEVRKFEASGLVERLPHHEVLDIKIEDDACSGVIVKDTNTNEIIEFEGPVILCTGGLNGFFPGMTTGTTANTGDLSASIFAKGVVFGNPEMIQYHPTTAAIPGKRLLISEAARGEGGRLFVKRNGEDWYFMEEKYPELGNLMPRDVVSREMFKVVLQDDCGDQVYLDMRHLKPETWAKKLSDLREEVIHYLGVDPAKDPIPLSPGIHFFMGGVLVDINHRSNVKDLWAAGECACQYHGANRLGGNSMLAAIYGGHVAAVDVCNIKTDDAPGLLPAESLSAGSTSLAQTGPGDGKVSAQQTDEGYDPGDHTVSPSFVKDLCAVLLSGLGILREEKSIAEALSKLDGLSKRAVTTAEKDRILLGRAMLLAALYRRESRGAHTRMDYPEKDDEHFSKTTAARFDGTEIKITYRDIPERRDG